VTLLASNQKRINYKIVHTYSLKFPELRFYQFNQQLLNTKIRTTVIGPGQKINPEYKSKSNLNSVTKFSIGI